MRKVKTKTGHFTCYKKRTFSFATNRPGSIKRGVKRKHFSLRRRAGVFPDIQSLLSSQRAESRHGSVAIMFCATTFCGDGSPTSRVVVGELANHGSIGDSSRLADGRMALLGYPREHMVARETWRQCARSLTRPGYLPSNPSAQQPQKVFPGAVYLRACCRRNRSPRSRTPRDPATGPGNASNSKNVKDVTQIAVVC
jgi:hypothetical protein